MANGKIFVYGTLKVGGHFARNFDEVRVSAVPATAKGTMFAATGWFPAVVFGGDNIIVGELHEYERIKEVIAALDRIEGYYKEGSLDNLYNRTKVMVTTEDGEEVEATAYEFNRATEGLEIIEGGTWEI